MTDRRTPSPLTIPLQAAVGAVWITQAVLTVRELPESVWIWMAGPTIAGIFLASVFVAAGIILRWRWFFYYALIGYLLAPVSLFVETSVARVAIDLVAFALAVVMLVASSYYSAAWAMHRPGRA